MINVNMRFNDGTYERLRDWIQSGTLDLMEGAYWLVAELYDIEKTGWVKGNCVAGNTPIRVWHLQQKPCSVLYRDRKPSPLQLNLTIDRAINGNQERDWTKLGKSVLVEPSGP
ncbi:hypothetical protein [Pseudomonas sp. NFACC39-1]|uniref:hypothetical protein n=1 Tax=Pseudomonas sp. NFACC39-1 TaxID=1566195 RepID=UPI0008D44BA4|nr:hypothetical protein [Pseudomonas sp. NFACC39-1]SEO19703.1 hypothetical protein SAMN03159293_02096 [Pseudomonas sp. NFACC39-1]